MDESLLGTGRASVMDLVAIGAATVGLGAGAWSALRERGWRRRHKALGIELETLRRLQELGRNIAGFHSSIFENAPLSMIATDREGLITAMNLAAERLTGYSRGDLVGMASMITLHDEKELEQRTAFLEPGTTATTAQDGFDVLTGKLYGYEPDNCDGESLRGDEDTLREMEWTYVRRDGMRVPVHLAVRAVTSETGEVNGYVGIAVDITERKEMLARVTHLATHDPLTKLAGRTILQENIAQAVERARRYGTRVAAFLIDIDQMKRINDSLGHSNGDKVLVEIADRLKGAVRSSDTVARVGGDEFVVVMPDIMSVEHVEQCGLNLVQWITPSILLDEHEVHVTASVGACIYPDFAADAKHLLKRADAAMYAAKEEGRNQFRVFSDGMLKETAGRLTMEHALRHAVTNGEMKLHYQPQVSLMSGQVIGMEGLLRWTHPKLGEVSPSVFVPLAEETGLIVPLGAWAFRTACTEGMQLRKELMMDFTISVNLSPRQFQQKDLLEVIESALEVSGLPARSLEIEITENMVMLNSESNMNKLQKIRELGAQIAIDDFGTGFSSFTYLLQYQVDRLKIDQSFVRKAVDDTSAAAVVRTIIAMSHGLNMKVVAEGVETEEQLRFLLRRKCDEAQGRFFSGPVPAEEFARVVEAMGETWVAKRA